jgi:hypothetical protein
MAAAVQATSTVPAPQAARTGQILQVPVGTRKSICPTLIRTSTVAQVQTENIRINQKTRTERKVS